MEKRKLTPDQIMSHVGELIGEHVHVDGKPLSDEERRHLATKLDVVYGTTVPGLRYYLLAKGESTAPMQLGTYVNPKLAHHTSYFAALDNMLKCVEKNAQVEEKRQETVCKRELTALQKEAFENKLLYHHVNSRWFQNELFYKDGQSPY